MVNKIAKVHPISDRHIDGIFFVPKCQHDGAACRGAECRGASFLLMIFSDDDDDVRRRIWGQQYTFGSTFQGHLFGLFPPGLPYCTRLRYNPLWHSPIETVVGFNCWLFARYHSISEGDIIVIEFSAKRLSDNGSNATFNALRR